MPTAIACVVNNIIQALIKVALRLVGAQVTQSVLYPSVVLRASDVRHHVDAASRPSQVLLVADQADDVVKPSYRDHSPTPSDTVVGIQTCKQISIIYLTVVKYILLIIRYVNNLWRDDHDHKYRPIL